MYLERIIDKYLIEWAQKSVHKPLLLRGARQTGKSTAVRHLGEQFGSYVEINFEKQPAFINIFKQDLDITRIVPLIATLSKQSITPGKTLLFLDEIQECPEAIMALRFFKEDMPELHVVAAGSLLEFALDQLPTFGVGRVHSMYMFPMTFDEFLMANGDHLLLEARNKATASQPLDNVLYQKLIDLLRAFMLVGGMPESVAKWVETHDFLQCQEVQDDILLGYEDDFPKYRKHVNPELLRQTLRSAAIQVTKKFVYSQVAGDYTAVEVKKALDLLMKAGLIIPVVHSSANGLPIGNDADYNYRKMLLLDTGLMLRLLNMSMGDISEITTLILTASAADFVNKGNIAEMLAGLEYLHYLNPNLRHELFYWVRQAKNSLAEIDYVIPHGKVCLPVEVKAGVQGGMKSLWEFMRAKKLSSAVRCSLENFGAFDYTDAKDENQTRHVTICPLFAVSQLSRLLQG